MFDAEMFMMSLPIMLKGMAGVFIATGIIILFTLIIGRMKTDKEQ